MAVEECKQRIADHVRKSGKVLGLQLEARWRDCNASGESITSSPDGCVPGRPGQISVLEVNSATGSSGRWQVEFTIDEIAGCECSSWWVISRRLKTVLEEIRG